MNRWVKTGALGVLVAAALAACTPRENFRGAILEERKLERLAPGLTQSQVTELLGSPSTMSTFGERANTWYYVYTHTEAYAFLRERVRERQVVIIDFDGSGRVREVRRLSDEDGEQIAFSDTETPTRGKQLGVLEQLLGNIGRYTGGGNAAGR